MLHGRRLATFLIVIVLLNPSQTVSGAQKTRGSNENDDLQGNPRNPVVHKDKTNLGNDVTAAFEHAQNHHVHKHQIQRKQVDQEHHLARHHDNINSRSDPGKNGEIYVKAMDRRVHGNNQEREDFSGEEIRNIHHNIHKTDHTREAADDDDHQFTRENDGKQKLHLHHKSLNENDGEFGYLTEDGDAALPEENDYRALSGDREYDHVHLKMSLKHRGVPHEGGPRDSRVEEETIELENAGDVDEEYSGDKQVQRKVRQLKKARDFHMNGNQIGQEIDGEEDEYSGQDEERVFKQREVRLLSEENESGEVDDSSGGKQKSTSDSKDEDKNLHRRDTKEEKKPAHDLYESKSMEKEQSSGNEYSFPKKSRVYRRIHLTDNDDFYIVENDEPQKKQYEVEMRNLDEETDIAGAYKEQSGKRVQNSDEGVKDVERLRRGPSRHLLQFGRENYSLGYRLASSTQCSHPAFPDKIPDDEIIYIRDECRLCECRMGELNCEPKPQLCDQRLDKKLCIMEKGEDMADSERHFDGCNNCLCRNGELLCTRVRCPLANYDYTSYHLLSDKTLNNVTRPGAYEGRIRGKDPCMECDCEPTSAVCGPNWKTYRSMCHAMHCAGHKIEHVKQGACESLNPCDEAQCEQHEICLTRRRSPCLATTTADGNIVECRQYQCVNPSQDCSSVLETKVCGEDHITYSNECAMFARGIALAYYGPCKEECLEDDPRMCGVDGVTFASSCHAALLNSHVDYPGECDDVDPQFNIIMRSSDLYYDRRCKTVKDLARCPPVDCTKHVIPEGSCCPICGNTSISIRLDTAAKDMITLKSTEDQHFYQLNRIALIYNTLKTLSNRFGSLDKCQLTADLVDTNDISVVFEPIKTEHEEACAQVAGKIVERINSPAKNDVDPGQALLAAAVVVDHSDPTLLPRAESLTSMMMAKRRKKRAEHHEHEPYYSKSKRIGPQVTVVVFYLALGFYWSKILA